MIATSPATDVEMLEERLERGLDLLFDMEQRGDLSHEYQRYLRFWLDLLGQYESVQAAATP
jgi:hypothetical protein